MKEAATLLGVIVLVGMLPLLFGAVIFAVSQMGLWLRYLFSAGFRSSVVRIKPAPRGMPPSTANEAVRHLNQPPLR